MGMSDVGLPGLDQLLPAFLPLSVALGCYLASLAVAGFLRRIHINLGALILLPLAVVYALSILLFAIPAGQSASLPAWHTATAKKLPRDFYGLSAFAVCVKPLGGPLATVGAPLPTGTPLLTFDPLNARVALWNPTTAKVTWVPAAGVTLTTVDSLSSSCA